MHFHYCYMSYTCSSPSQIPSQIHFCCTTTGTSILYILLKALFLYSFRYCVLVVTNKIANKICKYGEFLN